MLEESKAVRTGKREEGTVGVEKDGKRGVSREGHTVGGVGNREVGIRGTDLTEGGWTPSNKKSRVRFTVEETRRKGLVGEKVTGLLIIEHRLTMYGP